jgi:hypothetical protein
MPNIKEKNGAVLLTVTGRRGAIHRSMSIEDAEEFLEDLEAAIEDAREA